MARKQRRPGQGPKEQQPQQNAQQGSGGGGASWAPLRDAIRRDVEQAVGALAFAERLHAKLETQRRAFLDFPRVLEQLRSGALERLTASLSRLYEGGQGFDLQRFLRDLPLALAQLAAAEKKQAQSSQPPPAQGSQPPPAQASQPPTAQASQPPPGDQSSQQASGQNGAADASADSAQAASPPAAGNGQAASEPAAENAQAARAAPSETSPSSAEEPSKPSPRLELRAKMLAAAPNLAKAAQGYRRNVATLRRAATPRRSPGPWRADREVLEEASRAVEFVQKLYDTYAEAWADQPLPANLREEAAAETDRFLAWTQLDRYVELAVAGRSNTQKPAKLGQQVISAPAETPQPVTEASPSAVVQSETQGAAENTQAPVTAAAAQPSEDT
ncbi:MAG TPA: hypothetical protein VGH20_10965 [Myxococcales bacterium]